MQAITHSMDVMEIDHQLVQPPPNVCFNCGQEGHEEGSCIVTTDLTYRTRTMAWYLQQTEMYRSWLDKKTMPSDDRPVVPRPPPRGVNDSRVTRSTPAPPRPVPQLKSSPAKQPTSATSSFPRPPCLPSDTTEDMTVHNIDWEKKRPGPEMSLTLATATVARAVNVLLDIAKPAYTDPKFVHYRVGIDTPLPYQDIVDGLKDQTFFVFTGGETWEGLPFNMETAREKGMVVDETTQFEFIDMAVLAKAMIRTQSARRKEETRGAQIQRGEVPAEQEEEEEEEEEELHIVRTLPQFFQDVEEGKHLNLLELPFSAWGYPEHIRPLFPYTLQYRLIAVGDRTESLERTDPQESSWGLISSKGSYSEAHHDAGGRYTFIAQFMGVKNWIYFRPNDETVDRMRKGEIIAELKDYDHPEVMEALGKFYYVPFRGGMQGFQPSWIKHFVWTSDNSFTGGKLFDLGDFARVEMCHEEERASGLTSTNAERLAWWNLQLAIATSLSDDEAESWRTDDLKAWRRMLLNPCAYVPERDVTKAEIFRLPFWLAVDEFNRIRKAAKVAATKAAPGTEVKANRAILKAEREVSQKWWAEHTHEDEGLLPINHDARVQKLAKGIPKIEALLVKKGEKIEQVPLRTWRLNLDERAEKKTADEGLARKKAATKEGPSSSRHNKSRRGQKARQ